MRNLTILRRKSFIACLGTMKVYIEDPVAGNVTIQNTRCRLLGRLKNGETGTYAIDEGAARVFVIADQLSKNWSNDVYHVPAGTADISLSGKNHYNPSIGNPFYFDGMTNQETLRQRRRSSRKGVLLTVLAGVLGIALGIGLVSVGAYMDKQPKTFTVDGMSITLIGKFEHVSNQDYTACYATKHMNVLIDKTPYANFPELASMTLSEYAEHVQGLHAEHLPSSLKQADGRIYFTFRRALGDNTYTYLVSVYKSSDAFWQVYMICEESRFEEMQSSFTEWASSVKFPEA